MANFIFSIYFTITGNHDVSTWPFVYNIWLPFEVASIPRWYFKYFLEFCMSGAYYITLVLVTTFFMSCCLYITAFCNHFEALIDSINQNANDNSNGRKQRMARAKLVTMVDLHTDIYEWELLMICECPREHLVLIKSSWKDCRNGWGYQQWCNICSSAAKCHLSSSVAVSVGKCKFYTPTRMHCISLILIITFYRWISNP